MDWACSWASMMRCGDESVCTVRTYVQYMWMMCRIRRGCTGGDTEGAGGGKDGGIAKVTGFGVAVWMWGGERARARARAMRWDGMGVDMGPGWGDGLDNLGWEVG